MTDGVNSRGWRLVILDHFGELSPLDTDPVNATLQTDKANAAVLRTVSRRTDVAFVVVAPLRKAATFKDADKGKFHLDDVMGSAAIGYAIRTCVAVTAKYDAPPAYGTVQLRFLKNRNGPPQDQPLVLRWHASCGRICDPGPEATPRESGLAM